MIDSAGNGPIPPDETAGAEEPKFGCVYSTPAEALKELGGAYNYWTGKITDSTLPLCLAIIGGNWAVHQTREAILGNKFALASLGLVLVTLAANLVGALVMAELNARHFYRAQEDRKKWALDWQSAERTPMEWPYTRTIKLCGVWFSRIKAVFPLIGGLLLVVGVFSAPVITHSGN